MNNLIIIGAGGMGREIYEHATQCEGFNKTYNIKGFLDDRKSSLSDIHGYPLILGSISEYIIEPNDVFICSIGDVKTKKESIEKILAKGGKFISLIHPQAHVGKNTVIGNGSIILRGAHIGVDCMIDDYALIQISAIIGHDSTIGRLSRIDCNVVCVGGTQIKSFSTIHTSAVIGHNVTVGDWAVVGANSFVMKNVEEKTTVFGSPAVVLF